jgi:DNA-binding SARP family transcriptional activator
VGAARDWEAVAIRIDPTAETAHRALTRGYAELGETAEALRAFEGCRTHLAEELGADTAPQTRELHLRLSANRRLPAAGDSLRSANPQQAPPAE